MIVALLNQQGGVGKTTLTLHLAGQWAREDKRVTLIDADPRRSALDWSEQRAREGLPRLFGGVGLARDTLHREAPELACDADRIVMGGAPRIVGLMRSALLAADLVLIPAQPSPFHCWSSGEMLTLIDEACIFRSELVARFVLNRCSARTVIARETAATLAEHDPPLLTATVGQRVAFADAARTGRPCLRHRRGQSRRARDCRARRRDREDRSMTGRDPKRGFASRPGNAESWVKASQPSRTSPTNADAFTARLTVDITPELRGRIKVAAFRRGMTVADMLHGRLSQTFPDTDGGTP